MEELLMKSFEALQAAINGRTVEHARRLGLSTSMVNKWQEPHTDFTDSGAYNPLDRIETVVETALDTGMSFEQATTPIQYLNERFGIIGIALPAVPEVGGLSNELLKAIKEFGELAEAASKSLEDGKITAKEYALIEKEGWELIRQVTTFVNAAGEAVEKV